MCMRPPLGDPDSEHTLVWRSVSIWVTVSNTRRDGPGFDTFHDISVIGSRSVEDIQPKLLTVFRKKVARESLTAFEP